MKTKIKKSMNSNGEGYALNYELVSSKIVVEGEGYTVYGIALEMKDRNGKVLQSRTIRNMTTIKHSAIDYLGLVTRIFVTPEIIDDVVEDFLA